MCCIILNPKCAFRYLRRGENGELYCTTYLKRPDACVNFPREQHIKLVKKIKMMGFDCGYEFV